MFHPQTVFDTLILPSILHHKKHHHHVCQAMNESRYIIAIKCQVLITVQLFALNLSAFWHFFKCFFFFKTKKQQLFQLKSQRHLSYPLSSSPFLLSSIKTHTHTHTVAFFSLKYYHQTTLQFIHCPNPKNLCSCLLRNVILFSKVSHLCSLQLQ